MTVTLVCSKGHRSTFVAAGRVEDVDEVEECPHQPRPTAPACGASIVERTTR